MMKMMKMMLKMKILAVACQVRLNRLLFNLIKKITKAVYIRYLLEISWICKEC